MTPPPKPTAAPCGTCPYRRDVPSGVWAASEYAQLPGYDGETGDQVLKGAFELFHCHQVPARLCAGWVGCHDTRHLLALRMHPVDPSTFNYVSPVALFGSGAEAADHGMAGIDDPDPRARAAIRKLIGKIARR